MTLHGYMLFNADGTPLNCVGSWRVFLDQACADRYLPDDSRAVGDIALRRVSVEVREVGE